MSEFENRWYTKKIKWKTEFWTLLLVYATLYITRTRRKAVILNNWISKLKYCNYYFGYLLNVDCYVGNTVYASVMVCTLFGLGNSL